MTPFEQAVLGVLRRLEPGEVVTYGEVAAEAGFPGAARAVGMFLARAEAPVPWWRVVTSTGRLVPGNEAEHARRLRAEGVALRSGRVGIDRNKAHARWPVGIDRNTARPGAAQEPRDLR